MTRLATGKQELDQLQQEASSLQGRCAALKAQQHVAEERVAALERQQQHLAAEARTLARAPAPQSGAEAPRPQTKDSSSSTVPVPRAAVAVQTDAVAMQMADGAAAAASLRDAQQAQLLAEEAAARAQRQIQQCQADLANAKASAAMHEASAVQLQQALHRLQQEMAQATAAAPLAATAIALADTPRRRTASAGGTLALAVSPTLAARRAARWEATQQELAAARHELHELQLQGAVAAAEEARLTAAVGELRKQHALARQDAAGVQDQVRRRGCSWDSCAHFAFSVRPIKEGTTTHMCSVMMHGMRDAIATSGFSGLRRLAGLSCRPPRPRAPRPPCTPPEASGTPRWHRSTTCCSRSQPCSSSCGRARPTLPRRTTRRPWRP